MNDQIELLRQACLAVAGAETSCCPEAYDPATSPLDGHCGAVASLVQAIYGGDIVTGKVQGTTHYWNRFPDGTELDLTSCQFGGDGYTPLQKGRKVNRKGKLTHPRFLLFAQKVKERLGKHTGA